MWKLHSSEPTEVGPEEFTMTGEGSFSDMSGKTRIQVGELVTTQSSYTFGSQEVSFGAEMEGSGFAFIGGAKSVDGTSTVSLPRNGMDIMNLAAALRDGLTLEATTRTVGYHASQITEENGEVVRNQTTRTREQSAQYGLDQTSIRVKGTVQDADIEMSASEDLPFPVKFQVAQGTGGMTLPLSASTDLQDVSYDFSLEGLSLSDELWDMFDPQKTLSRDPVALAMDVSAKVLNKVDWLDFMTVKARIDSGDIPVELHEMKLNGLTLDMAGAKLTGSGSGRFDNTDLESFDGFPRPTRRDRSGADWGQRAVGQSCRHGIADRRGRDRRTHGRGHNHQTRSRGRNGCAESATGDDR